VQLRAVLLKHFTSHASIATGRFLFRKAQMVGIIFTTPQVFPKREIKMVLNNQKTGN
jgi:hypothetical protein